MKALLLVFLCCAVVAEASSAELRVFRKGEAVALPTNSVLASNVLALLASCTVHSAVYQAGADELPEIWKQTLESGSVIHMKFAKPATLALEAASNHGRQDYVVYEILVGLPEGRWAGPLRVRTGANVHSFGKYDPGALRRVAFEPALKLSSVSPYSGLAKLPAP